MNAVEKMRRKQIDRGHVQRVEHVKAGGAPRPVATARPTSTPSISSPPTSSPTAATPTPTATATPARAGNDKIVMACGHTVAVREIENVPCIPCRAANRRAKSAANDTNRRVHLDAQAKRLPDGAAFAVAYDAAAQRWSGMLTVPGLPAFTASASGVFTLLKDLDALYRRHGYQHAAGADSDNSDNA